MLNATRDLVLPTTITGSYPRPHWFTEELHGRSFKDALGQSRFRERYLDAVACLIREQEMAGLDIAPCTWPASLVFAVWAYGLGRRSRSPVHNDVSGAS